MPVKRLLSGPLPGWLEGRRLGALRPSEAKRKASTLNASLYLCRLSSDAPLFLAIITKEITSCFSPSLLDHFTRGNA